MTDFLLVHCMLGSVVGELKWNWYKKRSTDRWGQFPAALKAAQGSRESRESRVFVFLL